MTISSSKLGWYHGFAKDKNGLQSDAMMRGVREDYVGLTQKFDVTPAGLESQLVREQLMGGGFLDGIALHDAPDMKGLSEPELRLAIATLERFRSEKRFNRLGIGVKSVEYASEFVRRFPGVLDYAGVTSSPIVAKQLLQLLSDAQSNGGRSLGITLMGIYFGGAFTLTEDPATLPNFQFNYLDASEQQRAQMSQIFRICQKSQISLKQLAAGCAGTLMANFPAISQCIIGSLDAAELAETIELINTTTIPAPVITELTAMDILPRDFPKS